MKRPNRLLAAAAVVALLLLALSVYLQAWGGVALIVLAAAGYAWYHVQVTRSEAAEQFFGDMGEETRLTGFQAGSPSEMPTTDRAPLDPPQPPRH
jgi:hypothetical protein